MKLLVDLLDGYAKEGGELASNHCERVGYKDALGGGRRSLDERHILLNCGCQLCSLEVEHRMLGVPEFGGSPQEDPIHRGFSEHDHVSNNALNKGAIHRRSVLQMRMISCLGGVIASSLRPGAGQSILT
ncbi:hypothetical protein CRG98_024580 [Punica granatum]|uniref:Uncharacterized protein n=1 Tax=Punica granatum TaxID=22663 RepID=A0A2I0JFM3_PUNGR|nr:hypothetical protein CRG98_024580 [Punica granatum]